MSQPIGYFVRTCVEGPSVQVEADTMPHAIPLHTADHDGTLSEALATILPADPLTERKLFEARMRRVAPGVNLEMIGDRYNDLDTQWKFELWLDRAALADKGVK